MFRSASPTVGGISLDVRFRKMKTISVLTIAFALMGCGKRAPSSGANTFEYASHAERKIYLDNVDGFTPPIGGAGYLSSDASASIAGGRIAAIPPECVMRWGFVGEDSALPIIYRQSVVDLSHLPTDRRIGIRFEYSADGVWSAHEIRAVTF
jgi:hypothetical protein